MLFKQKKRGIKKGIYTSGGKGKVGRTVILLSIYFVTFTQDVY